MSSRQKKKKSAGSTAGKKSRNKSISNRQKQPQQQKSLPPKSDEMRSNSNRKVKKKLSTARSHSPRLSAEKIQDMMAESKQASATSVGQTTGSDSSSSIRSSGEMSIKSRIITKTKKKRSSEVGGSGKSEERPLSAQLPEESEDTRTPPFATDTTSSDIQTSGLSSISPSLREAMRGLLRRFAERCNNLTLEELTDQYNHLPDPRKEECKGYLDTKNRMKNRYCNIYCLDSSRVQLTFLQQDGAYIHANKVQYPSLKNPFIVTQGPLSRTVNDFWRMIWQEKSENIVMLCNQIENGRSKSTEYFRQQLGERAVYGYIAVKTCMRDFSDGGLVTTRLEVTYGQQTRTVMHYHMTDWRDCRAPVVCIRQMFELLRLVRVAASPCIVHCSAGVGRSGTLVALEMCLMDLAHGREVNVREVVHTLRKFRAHAVQTFEQYLAIHKFVLEFGEQNECVSRAEIANFYQLFQDYSRSLA